MKKLILTLLVAFFAASLAVSAQNNSKLSYNEDGSVTLTEELKTKLKAKGISEEDYLNQMAVNKQGKQPVQQQKIETQAKQTEPKVELKTIDKAQLKTDTQENFRRKNYEKRDLIEKPVSSYYDKYTGRFYYKLKTPQ